jgi:copper chaperone CopZ
VGEENDAVIAANIAETTGRCLASLGWNKPFFAVMKEEGGRLTANVRSLALPKMPPWFRGKDQSMKITRINIQGMTCANCATHVQKALEAVPGVKDVRVALREGATIEHEGATEDQLLRAVRAAGDYNGEVAR